MCKVDKRGTFWSEYHKARDRLAAAGVDQKIKIKRFIHCQDMAE